MKISINYPLPGVQPSFKLTFSKQEFRAAILDFMAAQGIESAGRIPGFTVMVAGQNVCVENIEVMLSGDSWVNTVKG